MLLYVKEVLPVLKSCIWVCGGTRDGLSAGGNGIRSLVLPIFSRNGDILRLLFDS